MEVAKQEDRGAEKCDIYVSYTGAGMKCEVHVD